MTNHYRHTKHYNAVIIFVYTSIAIIYLSRYNINPK